MTNSHCKTLTEESYRIYQEQFVTSIKMQTQAWKSFYEYWISLKVPLYIIRYEDLLLETEPTLEKLFKYLLRTDNYEDSTIYKRLKFISKKESPKRQIYQPRKALVNSC